MAAIELMDMLTDMLSVIKLRIKGHIMFAAVLPTCVYTSTLLQLRQGHWRGLAQNFRDRVAGGLSTQGLLKMLDSGRGWKLCPGFSARSTLCFTLTSR